MRTYQDLLEVGNDEGDRITFALAAIRDHEGSHEYRTAKDAQTYAKGKNATISRYQKLLYKITGEAVPDNYTANHKCKSGFFKRFITQEVAVELGNGVSFGKDDTKGKLGKDVDMVVYNGAKSALVQGVSYGFYNMDHIVFFDSMSFVPLRDERTNKLMAGIRYWQLAADRPLRFTIFEVDGYTEYIREKDKPARVYKEKRAYTETVAKTEADGEEIIEEENYSDLPIVPLYANEEHQSELEGRREQIDCYDLIKSGFANDLDDASMIYWTLTNCGGMDDMDLVKFLERMKTIKAAVVGENGEEGARAEAHTVDVPYQSREVYLTRLETDLYRDFMALNPEQIAAGQITATQIKAAYEPLNEKCDEFEMQLCTFFGQILALAGVEDDEPTFKRSKISNEGETVQMVLACAEYLDAETILRKLPFLSEDEIADIMKRKEEEAEERFKQMQQLQGGQAQIEGEDE